MALGIYCHQVWWASSACRIADSAACARFTPVQQVAICSKVNFARVRQKNPVRGVMRADGVLLESGILGECLGQAYHRKIGNEKREFGLAKVPGPALTAPARRPQPAPGAGAASWNLGRRICKSRRCPWDNDGLCYTQFQPPCPRAGATKAPERLIAGYRRNSGRWIF